MKRGKIAIMAGMVVGLVAVIAAAVILFNGLSEATRTRNQRDDARRRLESFYQSDPFPSAENVEIEKNNLATARDWSRSLLDELQHADIRVTERQPRVFSSRREAIIADLIASAPVGEAGEKVVTADFAFGFDAYKGGQSADTAHVQRLIRQLLITEQLIRAAYDSKVLRISGISRDQFESGSSAAGPAGVQGGGRRGGRRGGPDPVVEEAAVPSGHVIEGPVPMTVERFTMQLTANEVSLVELMNRIAKLPVFAVITRMDFNKQGSDYKPPAQEREATGSGIGTGQAAIANPLPISRTARLVTGRDREASLSVTLDIEVYSFAGEEEED